MLKTFNVVEKYEEILPFLDAKKNQSSFICELILTAMRDEQIRVNMESLNDRILNNVSYLVQDEIRKGIREEIREEIRLEVRTEIRSEFRDLNRIIDRLEKKIEELSTEGIKKGNTPTREGASFRMNENGQMVRQDPKPLNSFPNPFQD